MYLTQKVNALLLLVLFYGLLPGSSLYGAEYPTMNHLLETAPEKNILYVNSSAAAKGDGKSWSTAFHSLQQALDQAKVNTEIWVAKGIYIPEKIVGKKNKREKSFQLKNKVTLLGGFAGNETKAEERDWAANETILSGDLKQDDKDGENTGENCFHVVTGNGTDSTAIIDGFTITGGNANMDLWPHDGGGGMNNEEGSPTVKNCLFFKNFGFADGGGMRNWGNCRPLIIDCVFKNNEAAQEGGGMMNGPDSQTQVVNCRFLNNLSGEDGGGMYNNETVNQLVVNCLFYDNTANLTGAGMYNVNNSAPQVMNCTFTSNKAKEAGGGISNRDANPVLINCILWNNEAPENDEVNNLRSTPAISYCNVSGGYDGANNIDADPGFAKESYELTKDSPCIDAGNTNALPKHVKTDFDAKQRVVGKGVDLGAYEFGK